MSARNSFRDRRCSSVLPHLAPAPRVPHSVSSTRDLCPHSSKYDRSVTSYYDFLSESDGTGTTTPDFRSEESDSSTGSVLERATAEATRILADEWNSIERTLYGEEGQHITRPQLVEECQQWRELFPHLRVVGKKIALPEKRSLCQTIAEEEIFAMHYSDYEEFSESEERYSESSFSDTTPQNSPRTFTHIPTEPRLHREKSAFPRSFNDGLNESFYSMLQITPLYPRSPPLSSVGKRHYSSILKSEISSSKWMTNSTPESFKIRPLCGRNSAKSFISLDVRNCNGVALSATERKKVQNEARVCTAKPKDNERLQSLPYQTITNQRSKKPNNLFANGKVWLPPLHIDEEKSKSKLYLMRRNNSKKSRRTAAPRAVTLLSESDNYDKF